MHLAGNDPNAHLEVLSRTDSVHYPSCFVCNVRRKDRTRKDDIKRNGQSGRTSGMTFGLEESGEHIFRRCRDYELTSMTSRFIACEFNKRNVRSDSLMIE
jgi:hypothetical protein